jgi:S1-C subfamily serine protease
MRAVSFIAALLLLLPTVAFAGEISAPKNVQQMHQEMLYPTVLVRAGSGTGSGTVIFSEERDGEYLSLVLTNHPVVKSNIKISEEWNPQAQEKVERETRRPVLIDLWEYNNFSDAIGTIGRQATIEAWDKDRDLALLRVVDSERPLPFVAELYPENQDDGPWIFQQVYAVGAGLGKPPFPTEGLLAGFARDKDGRELYLATAPIIFGSSGGSLFVRSTRHSAAGFFLIGVPSMVSAYGWAGVVTHMGWSRPITEIRFFLRANDYGFVLGDDPVEEPALEEDN